MSKSMSRNYSLSILSEFVFLLRYIHIPNVKKIHIILLDIPLHSQQDGQCNMQTDDPISENVQKIFLTYDTNVGGQ